MPTEWQAVTEFPPLDPGELQIWRADLHRTGNNPDPYTQNLSPAEVERAGRYRFGRVRLQFVVARASLRVLLGNLLGIPANVVPITLSAYGKPEIAPANGDPIYFNLAHARDTVLIALCRASPLGIDLEYLDRETDALDIARNSFHQNELIEIERIAEPVARQAAFFRCWTRKEAVIKADGRGLSLALSSFQVPVLEPAASAAVSVIDGEDAAPRTWFVRDIALGGQIAGAFAAGVPSLATRTYRFPLEIFARDRSKG